ncbi:hypothetical protein KAR91_41895 [Candidatus Pacearchaeota archaeon]|nr:hypothetical protein [Candidatus Pacearchaeota archaeon]
MEIFKSKYLKALHELGGEATALQVKKYLMDNGIYAATHLVHHGLYVLKKRGKAIKTGVATYRLAE